MVNISELLYFDKSQLKERASLLTKDDIDDLVALLDETNDKIRYIALLLLQFRSISCNDVYRYWDNFSEKLRSDNSYQRSIGLILISENIVWDDEAKFLNIINEYLNIIYDKKPIAVRKMLQSLLTIVKAKADYQFLISNFLMTFNINNIKATMRKLVLYDILKVLAVIYQDLDDKNIKEYIFLMLNQGLLDNKMVKEIKELIEYVRFK